MVTSHDPEVIAAADQRGLPRTRDGEAMSTVVRLANISKSFRRGDADVVVLNGLEAEIDLGEVVIIRGRSGSGKTTLLNILAGWQEPGHRGRLLGYRESGVMGRGGSHSPISRAFA